MEKEFPQFDVVVTAEGADVPPHELAKVNGTRRPSWKWGTRACTRSCWACSTTRISRSATSACRLNTHFANAPNMKQLMVAYQEQLKQLGLEGSGGGGRITALANGGRPGGAIHRLGEVRRVPQDRL